jgi:hypothetical protein
MPDVTTSTYTNESTGVREMGDTIFEDVEGTIQLISPADTPFQASIGMEKATNILHEWLEDELETPTGTNAAVEGADAVAAEMLPPERLSSHTQIVEKSFKMSGTMEAVNTIGRQDHAKYLLGKSLKYLKTEIEKIIINNATDSAGTSTTARTTKGLDGWISTNDKSYSSYADTNDFDETKFMAMAESAYSAGGYPSILMVPPKQAVVISNWDQAGKITVNQEATSKTLTMAVMVLETPFGLVNVVIDKWISTDTSTVAYDRVFLYDPEKLAIAWLRKLKTVPLAKTGDNTKYQSLGEFAFVCRSEKAHAKCKKCAQPY